VLPDRVIIFIFQPIAVGICQAFAITLKVKDSDLDQQHGSVPLRAEKSRSTSVPVVDELKVAKLPGLAGGVNLMHSRLAPRVSVVEIDVQMSSGMPIGADIPEVVKR
jgi:hypothetical protein